MYVTLKFDTEDVNYPPKYRIDDIPGWLAEIMAERGICGTFCVTGEKARSLKDRGRDDVIEKMCQHNLVSHQQGNVRPLIPEILRDKGWTDGLAEMRAYEDKVAEDFRYAFGRDPQGMGRHNAYIAAQHIAVAGERGLPYLTVQDELSSGDQPAWFAGALILPASAALRFNFSEVYFSCDDAIRRLHERPG